MGALLVIGENGTPIADASALPPRNGNYADRDYFLVHKERGDIGLYVGRPLVSRLTGYRILPLSRRINKADGSFGGVAVGTLKLDYFTRLFDRIGLGREGAINLFHRDGTRIMRHPFVDADIGVSIAGSSNFERFVGAQSGSFVADSVRDGVRRHYAFTQVGTLPLILNVALSADEIEAGWRAKALVVGVIVVTLCLLTAGLSLLFGRELKRRSRMQAELARLSLTDPLTGLPNRRRFAESLSRAWTSAARSGSPLSLLMVDADHFKRVNDRHGHVVGDKVLQELALALSASAQRPDDLVCRFGGEEFAVVLPGTSRAGALRVAETIHARVAAMTLSQAGSGPAVTVSIGLATTGAGELVPESELLKLADQAVYEAKARGRNRTECGNASSPARQTRGLRLVAARASS